jgi:hypothetical protein
MLNSTPILTHEHPDARTSTLCNYLRGLASVCLEVAQNPQPRLVQFLAEVLWRAPRTISELTEGQGERCK